MHVYVSVHVSESVSVYVCSVTLQLCNEDSTRRARARMSRGASGWLLAMRPHGPHEHDLTDEGDSRNHSL